MKLMIRLYWIKALTFISDLLKSRFVVRCKEHDVFISVIMRCGFSQMQFGVKINNMTEMSSLEPERERERSSCFNGLTGV